MCRLAQLRQFQTKPERLVTSPAGPVGLWGPQGLPVKRGSMGNRGPPFVYAARAVGCNPAALASSISLATLGRSAINCWIGLA